MPEYTFKKLRPVFQLMDNGPISDRPVATVERLGAGTWCTAYRDVSSPETVYLRVKPGDSSKHILSDCDGSHIPQLERIGMSGDDDIWRTRYYERLSAKHKAAWSQYRRLSKENMAARVANMHQAWNSGPRSSVDWGYAAMVDTVSRMDGTADRTLQEALQAIVDSAANYGQSYTFEFAPRNLAVDGDGTLILLDPIFDLEAIRQKQDAARRRAQGRYRL